jgi:hypothetical protein
MKASAAKLALLYVEPTANGAPVTICFRLVGDRMKEAYLAAVFLGVLVTGCSSSGSGVQGSVGPAPASTTSLATSSSSPSTSASTPEPTPTAAPTSASSFHLSVGTAATISDNDSTARITVVAITKSTQAPNEFAGPPTHGQYVIADVLYECLQGTCSPNPLFFGAHGSDGRDYDAALGGSPDPQLSSNDLVAARSTRGYVAFDVPVGPGEVVYTGLGFGGDGASWDFT